MKIRGFRIELGEVEAVARAMWDEPVEVAAVVVEEELVLFVPAEAMHHVLALKILLAALAKVETKLKKLARGLKQSSSQPGAGAGAASAGGSA